MRQINDVEDMTIYEPSESIEAQQKPRNEPSVSEVDAHEKRIRKEESIVLQTPVIKLTRRQLYDEIWEISVAGVAKKYGVPYSCFMKQVKEANIPFPPSGYWTKLNFGKPVTKIKLSEPFDEMIQIFDTLPTTRKEKAQSTPKSGTTVKPLPERNKSDERLASVPRSQEDFTIKAIPMPAASRQEEHAIEVQSAPSLETVDEPETIKQHGQTYNVYNRETLYKEVWEAPVTEVAKRYKVSDVAIHKVCKALDIPTPSLGYWAKARAGKPITVIPLPKSDKVPQKTGVQTGVTNQLEVEKERLAFLSEEDRSVLLAVASQILLPDAEARMHSKIAAHRKTIAEWKKKLKENERKGWNRRNMESPPFLADSVSDEAFPRACRIIDALIKAMEPLGCSLTDNLGFVVNGETVGLSFSESQDKVAHIPTKEENMQLLKYEEERKRYTWASKPQIRKYDNVYNGRICLTIIGQKSFRDCKSYVVEDRLGDIMIEMYEAAEAIKIARKAREEAERQRKEEERRREERRERYNMEIDRTLVLTNFAEDYDIACKIRRYIAAVEASDSQRLETAEWIEWAKAKADWYDPTVAKEDAYFGKREHQKDVEKKKLQHKGYWW